MGLFFWKNNRTIDEFAQGVADDLFSFVTPELAEQHVGGKTGKWPKKQQVRVEQKFADVVVQFQRFTKANSLGIYGKARLQQAFNERLGELGYPADVVTRISESLLLRIS